MPTHTVISTYDARKTQQAKFWNRFDAIKPNRVVMAIAEFDAESRVQAKVRGDFDAVAAVPLVCVSGNFDSNGFQYSGQNAFFDACRLRDQTFSAVPGFFGRTPSGNTVAIGRFDIFKPYRHKVSGKFDAWFRMQNTAQNGCFDALAGVTDKIVGLFDAMPDKTRSAVIARFDAVAETTNAVPFSFQAFVRPGWRLRLKNTETEEIVDLCFIDADSPEKAIKDVTIPDGDYEILVTTSSLFWKDTVDRFARTISIRSGQEPTIGLPPVLGLYSEVENGVTTIYWSTHAGDDSGASFGLWFSTAPPVDMNRSPDQQIEYVGGQIDYQYRMTQTEPLWLAVMPFKNTMHGQAVEIFLNWSDLKPRRPYDQTARNVYLDENLPELQQD